MGEVKVLPRKEEPGITVTLGSSRGTPQICHRGIQESSIKKASQLKAQRKCLYNNACTRRNKPDKMETTVLLENCDLIAITET